MTKSLTSEMLSFIEASPTPYHCVAEVARRLQAAAFKELDERSEPQRLDAGGGYFIRRGGTIVAFRAGTKAPAAHGFVMLGAHTDSPNLRLKPRADVTAAGFRSWGVEVYGGVLLSTWMDRDLGLAGRVTVAEGDVLVEKLVRIDAPIARVPNLAIHLNRGVNDTGLILDKQKHLPPVVAMEDGPALAAVLAKHVDGDVLGYDLALFDLQAPTLGGLNNEFIFSARLDNQASCFAALESLLHGSAAAHTSVVALFDHEEIGSRSATGAMSGLMKDILSRIVRDHSESATGGLERALANSFMVSLDMAHGVHPNYADKHEALHAPVLNGGPVLKEHVEQRYATDGPTGARFRKACLDVDVALQDFVIRTDLACGSTIGPITSAELGVATVDLGNPMLSMHSIREMGGADDTELMVRVLRHVVENGI